MTGLTLSRQHSQRNREDKEEHSEIDGAFLQHVGGLGTHKLRHGSVTKGRAKSFLPRALHENDENHEEADENFDHRENTNQNVHKGRRIWGQTFFWQAASHPLSGVREYESFLIISSWELA
jgi:hypothetical protein